MVAKIDFWYSIGSLYSYLSVMRIADIERERGTQFNWRPFSVRQIMKEMDNLPVNKPVKMAYMWRDLARRADMYGLKAKLPVPYPLEHFDLANQVAVLGSLEGWCADYTKAAYFQWFERGDPAGTESNLSASLSSLGLDPVAIVEKAQSKIVLDEFESATDEARALGVFGAPTFAVDDEIFWGDDRLDDAVTWQNK